MAEKSADLITREEKISQAKELYNRGSRNYLVKSYEEAADDLSQVCSLYSELYGELSNELGMPYLLYAKSLIALALEENKVVDIPEEEEDDDDDEDDDGYGKEGLEQEEKKDNDGKMEATSNSKTEANDKKEVVDEATDDKIEKSVEVTDKKTEKPVEAVTTTNDKTEKSVDVKGDIPVATSAVEKEQDKAEDLSKTNGTNEAKPGTSNGAVEGEDTAQENEEENDEAATNLQVAWETLELAARIFENQGESALPNLAEVFTELANIEFENNIMQPARDDYNKALEIYKQLSSNYRRPMAEIYYKIGLSHLMEQASKESADFLKQACEILDEEINEMKTKENPTDKDKHNLQDMEETKQEIWAKITEIEESLQQCISEVRAAIQNHMNPHPARGESSGAGPSSSSSSSAAAATAAAAAAVSASSSLSAADKPKPTDISHLIKRKKPDSATNDTEMSPAKRPAT